VTGTAGEADFENLALIDRCWRAANYLSVGQIYLMDNPLLREPLANEALADLRAGRLNGRRCIAQALCHLLDEPIAGNFRSSPVLRNP